MVHRGGIGIQSFTIPMLNGEGEKYRLLKYRLCKET